jgi:uncharacterized protein (TIGR02147 family)
MKIYDFSDYKSYLKAQIHAFPNRGRGEMTRIAKALDIHTTMVTHVLKGKQNFTLEQTLKLAEHWALNELETEFLVALVNLDRAGDRRAKSFCQKRVEELRARARDLSVRLETKNELSESDRAEYYSSWVYTYLRLLSAIDGYSSAQAMAKKTGLPLATVRRVLEFLISHGLCREESGRVSYGAVKTYLESSSPLVVAHHLNWRRKTSECFDHLRGEDLVFTYPVVLAEKEFLVVREHLVRFIEEFKQVVSPSPSEELYCLNLEWLRM